MRKKSPQKIDNMQRRCQVSVNQRWSRMSSSSTRTRFQMCPNSHACSLLPTSSLWASRIYQLKRTRSRTFKWLQLPLCHCSGWCHTSLGEGALVGHYFSRCIMVYTEGTKKDTAILTFRQPYKTRRSLVSALFSPSSAGTSVQPGRKMLWPKKVGSQVGTNHQELDLDIPDLGNRK